MKGIDEIDKKILALLQENSRITNKELSEQLGLSTTPIFERVKKLEKSGLINKYVAILDRKLAGKELLALIAISLQKHSKPLIESFIKQINALPEILEFFHTTGKSDFIIKVAIADMDEYQDFIINKLSAIDEVANLETSFVMSEIKSTTTLILN
ncbi:MAG: Lrp/AsnC family leucine-responsive transcriptional regulator [Flavobacteriales bacterium]|jgi:Lrp/AsnC family leucine-responsive transcriptional regulator